MKKVIIKCKGSELRGIDALVEFQGDLKSLPEENYQRLKREIIDLGFVEPITVWSQGNKVLNGHQRLKTLKRMRDDEGYEVPLIPVTLVDADCEHAARKIVLSLTAQYGVMTAESLARYAVEAELGFEDIMHDFAFAGLDVDDFEKEMRDLEKEMKQGMVDDGSGDGLPNGDKGDKTPTTPKTTIIKTGDLVTLGYHRILCGDSSNLDDIKRVLAGDKPDMILTDPPYGMNLDASYKRMKATKPNHFVSKNPTKHTPIVGDDQEYDPSKLIAFFDDVKEQFWFGADYYADRIVDRSSGSMLVWDKRKESQSEGFGSEFELIWSRARHKRRVLRHDWFGFLSTENPSEARRRVHPTQKPTSLLVEIVEKWGQDANIVVDPYLGSGSTLIACQKVDRFCLGVEIDPLYIDVIISRWCEFTGKHDIMINGKPLKWLNKSTD